MTSIYDGVPLDPDGEPEPPLNANKRPSPDAEWSTIPEGDDA